MNSKMTKSTIELPQIIAVPSCPNSSKPPVVGSTVYYGNLRERNREACKKYREKNKEKLKEKAKALRSTVEFKVKRNKKLKENRLKDPSKTNEYQKKYRLENPDKIKKYQHKNKKLHPDKRKSRKRKDKENQRANITNEYVKILLSNKLGVPYSEVKKYPKLIELHREIIKIKRYAKQNEN
jgi:hypothetical protein